MKLLSVVLVLFTAFSLVLSQQPLYQSYVIKGGDLEVEVLNIGAVIHKFIVPDRYGNKIDIVLGYNTTTTQYENTKTYFGAAVGRVANRIANGTFTMDGVTYHITLNENPVDPNGTPYQTLHGGKVGWSMKFWDVVDQQPDQITLQLISPDGDQGFPGEVTARVTYQLTAQNEFNVTFTATTTKKTPINMASHSYFNLDGQDEGTDLYHMVQIHGSDITPVDSNAIPTGVIMPVIGTGYDLRKPRVLWEALQQLPNMTKGFDINYCLVPQSEYQNNYTISPLRKAVNAFAPATGIFLELSTNLPGVQFYNGVQLDNEPGKNGQLYQKFGSITFECQTFPNYVNTPSFPQVGFFIEPGQEYIGRYFYNFSTFDAWPYGLY